MRFAWVSLVLFSWGAAFPMETVQYTIGSQSIKVVGKSEQFFEGHKLQSAILAESVKIEGVEFKEGAPICFYPSGKVNYGTPVHPVQYAGIELKGDPFDVFFFESGKVMSGYVAPGQKLLGIDLKDGVRGEPTEFFESGKPQSLHLAKSQTVQGVILPAGTSVFFAEDGKLSYAYLGDNASIDGFEFGGAKGTGDRKVTFHPNGKVSEGRLSRDQTIQGYSFPEGSRIWFHPSGKMSTAWSSKPITIHGVELRANESLTFDEKGHLKEGRLAREQTLQGITFSGATYFTVQFHGNGKIASGTLARNQIVNGIEFLKETTMTFYETGKIESGFLSKPQKIGGIEWTNSGKISVGNEGHGPARYIQKGLTFYPSGKVRIGYLAKTQKIEGLDLWGSSIEDEYTFRGEDSKVELFENGKLKFGGLMGNQIVQGVPLQGVKEPMSGVSNTVLFYESGKLEGGYLGKTIERDGITFAEARWIELYPSGKIRLGVLGKTQTINGIELPAGTPVRFSEKGEAIHFD